MPKEKDMKDQELNPGDNVLYKREDKTSVGRYAADTGQEGTIQIDTGVPGELTYIEIASHVLRLKGDIPGADETTEFMYTRYQIDKEFPSDD